MKPNKYDQNNHTGKYRNKIEVQEFTESVNENGYPVEEWKTKHSLWSNIKTVKGSETISAASELNTDTYRFIVRYTSGLHAKMRVLFKGRIFDIQAILNDDEMLNTQTIVAIARNRDDGENGMTYEDRVKSLMDSIEAKRDDES